MNGPLRVAVAFALFLAAGHCVDTAVDVSELSSEDLSIEATPEERSAEAAWKKNKIDEQIESTQINNYHSRKSNAYAEYDRSVGLSKAMTSEIEWKRKLAGGSGEAVGRYAKGRYAMNDTDWEKKKGGYPTDMVAAEVQQKKDRVKLDQERGRQAREFQAKEAAGKKAHEKTAELGRKAQQASWGNSSNSSNARRNSEVEDASDILEDGMTSLEIA